ncbi:MAG: hypothetical protein DSY80_07575 [Desulfocapsa sp.]|nr:MAG: hypothetical protein DSY80_07575 [Desulfocapsa sp.]
MPEKTTFKLLIVEDDPGIATMLNTFFTSRDVSTQVAPDGRQALELVTSFEPDIIILDIVLPYVDGLSVLDTLQKQAIRIPVILLTDKRSVEEKLAGFEHGADDYVTKPFSPKELWMRVQAILRRSKPSSENTQGTVTVGNLSIDPLMREVLFRGKIPLAFTKTEFDLLYYLAQRQSQAVAHASLLSEVMGYSSTSQTKALVIHVANIRKKFKANNIHDVELAAVPGIGYKLLS